MSGIVGGINSKSRIIEPPEEALLVGYKTKSYSSADDILAQNPGATNGVYWIDLPTSHSYPIRVLCDFETVSDGSPQAGGYMLAGRFTDTAATTANWISSSYSVEYESHTSLIYSRIREVATFQYLRIAWNGGVGTAAPIYDFTPTSGGLVNAGSGTKSRVSSGIGSTGILTVTGWSLEGSYSASTLYHNLSPPGHRGSMYSNYNNNAQNQDGPFSTGGTYGGTTLTSSSNSNLAWVEFWIK